MRGGSRPSRADALATDLGVKDTVVLGRTRRLWLAMDFTLPQEAAFRGAQRFMFHCHNLEHEDGMMMRNFTVVEECRNDRTDFHFFDSRIDGDSRRRRPGPGGNENGGTISLIDTARDEVVGEIKTGGKRAAWRSTPRASSPTCRTSRTTRCW